MATNLGPLCYGCALYHGVAGGVGFVCDAYPKGIPVEIMASLWDHHEPQKGDHGLTYKPMATDFLATDPPVSEKQRRAMWAAASGHSNIGIPEKVGKEFANADPGGKLPNKAKDMEPQGFQKLAQLLMQFFKEEAAEPEHKDQGAEVDTGEDVTAPMLGGNSSIPSAAGVACTTKDGHVLMVKRNKAQDHGGEWTFPGGNVEDGEDPEQAARRELKEETGHVPESDLKPMHQHSYHGVTYQTFITPVGEGFRAKTPSNINDGENTEAKWFPVDCLPEDTHPGVRKTVDESFKKLEGQLAHKKGVHDPAALAASIGRKNGKIPTDDFDDPQTKAKLKNAQEVESQKYDEEPEKKPLFGKAKNKAEMLAQIADHGKKGRDKKFFGKDDPSHGQPESRVAREMTSDKPRKFFGKDEPGHGMPVAHVAREMTSDSAIAMDWAGSAELTIRGVPTGMAFDKTARTFDKDGFLHVDKANISKANVCPYMGSEIPDGDKMGLDPKKTYLLYRHPAELKKAADSFNGKPILCDHIPVSADTIDPEMIVGTTGRDAHFDGEYLTNSLDFWPKNAIDGIESSQKKQLSCGYRYTADMTPGVSPQGEKFDGIMRNIVGNHVALVKEGRAGPDVMVTDAKPRRRLSGAWRRTGQ